MSSGDIYTHDDVVGFTALAGPLSTAIENARLYQKLTDLNIDQSRILANMREGVIVVDKKGIVITINQSARDMLGVMPLGRHLRTLSPGVARVLEHTLETQRGASDFETHIVTEGDPAVPVVMSSCYLERPGRDTAGAMAMIYDLTQVRRLERNVARADRLSTIGTLAAGMAHEIKNPLVSIKTFTQLLPARYTDEDFRETFSDIVPHEVDRIDTIVSRLLDFARPKPVCFIRVNICNIVTEVLALVENQSANACIETVMDFPDSAYWVKGDDQQLHQAFLNLVLNALDAMDAQKGGTLTITAKRAAMYVRKKSLDPETETQCVNIEVSDTGPGIYPDQLPHLFTPFFTTKDDGCGLGLSVVHGIITEHGGEIDIVSQPGNGATFIVSLPLAENLSTVESL